jgi:outer membrane lipoprotein-sorting protein
MARIWGAVLALSLVGSSVALAEETAGPAAVIDKAIQAVGGEALLAKYQAATWKSKGTFYGMGQPMAYTAETAIQYPDKSRTKIDAEVNDTKFSFVTVFNHDKAWMKNADQEPMEAEGDQLEASKDETYNRRVNHLEGLNDKSFKLTILPDAKVGDHAAVGVKVSSPGHKDVSLYFDKQNGLLLKSETRAKNQSGEETKQESFFSDYKEVDGLKLPTKVVVKRDGNPYVDAQYSDLKLFEKLDDNLFKFEEKEAPKKP